MKRQTSRADVARTVIRALLGAARDGLIEWDVVGKLVVRIIRAWPTVSRRADDNTRRTWMKVLREELEAHDTASEHAARLERVNGS